ncbi:MAG: transposase [Proteobacteria bacterium]|nr:transposase [Pseudomonadota bacterium]
MDKIEAIPRDSTSAAQFVEVITGHERRRSYSDAEKARLIAEASQPGARVHDVARRHGICSSLLYRWRRQGLGTGSAGSAPPLMPARVSTEAVAPVMAEAADRRRSMPVIEITLPNGCTLRVDQHVDAKALRRILAALHG